MFVATNICPDRTFVATKNMFVATKVYKKTCYGETNTCLSRQTRVSRDKAIIATKMILMAAPANDSEGVNFR